MKKLLVSLLCVMMVFCMMPTMAFAEGVEATPAAPTAAEILSAKFAEGGEIKLTEDVTVGATLVVAAGKTVTLDLNGHTLTVSNGKINVENGKIIVKDSGTGENSGNLVIQQGYGIFVTDGGTAIIDGGTISSKFAPLSGNNTTGAMNFEINGGTLTAEEGPAVYMPGQVSLKMTGGTLNGGISLRMGQVSITGGIINSISKGIDSPAGYYDYSGNAWLPDALYVFGGTYTFNDPEYGNSLNLNITGGTFNCINDQGSAVAIYDLGHVAQSMDVRISGNTVLSSTATNREAYDILTLSEIGVENPKAGFGNEEYVGKVTSSVTGGTFSTKPADEYLASNYYAAKNADDTYTVYYSAPYVPSTPAPKDNVTNTGAAGAENAATKADLSNTTTSKTEGEKTTTTATVDKTTADKIVEKAVENKSEEVVIDATANTAAAAASTTAAQVELPKETLSAIAEKTDADVTIKTDVAEVKMDNAAAGAAAEQAAGETIQLVVEKVDETAEKVEFELKLVCSDGTEIHDFKGGNVAITVAVPKAMAEKKIVCVYINDKGRMSKVEGQLNADGTYTFTTGHFSTYALMSEEEADTAIAEQKAAIENTKITLSSKQVKMKNGKKAIKLTWKADSDVAFDGVEVYRSTKRYSGFGKKAIYTATEGVYYNTAIKAGTKYYYKVKAYVEVEGEKIYTDYSTKAWRTVK